MVRKALIVIAVLLLAIQLVPIGRDHTNPPMRQEPAWDSPQTRTLARRACFDCHSNQTVWPWYSNVAPMSWLVWHDVSDGRQSLNFSEWDRPQRKASKAAEEVEKGEMPPAVYLPMHPEAKLTASERAALVQGLKATIPKLAP